MKLPKMTIRRAMIAVAIAALLLGFWSRVMFSRRQSHLSDAAYHARREGEERRNLETFERNRRAGAAAAANNPSMAEMERASLLRVAYHAGLKDKYREAAAHPWASIPPDPKDPGEGLLWESLDPGPLMNEFRLSSEDWKDLSLSR